MKVDLKINGFFFRRFPSKKVAERYVFLQNADVRSACTIVPSWGPAPTAATGKALLDPTPGAGSFPPEITGGAAAESSMVPLGPLGDK